MLCLFVHILKIAQLFAQLIRCWLASNRPSFETEDADVNIKDGPVLTDFGTAQDAFPNACACTRCHVNSNRLLGEHPLKH